jgi:Mn-dependent DtxR family transcriptional regulator
MQRVTMSYTPAGTLMYSAIGLSPFLSNFQLCTFFHSLSRVIPNLWHFEENFGTAPHGNSIPQAERKRKI